MDKAKGKIDLVEQARQARLAAETLERNLKRARGTRDDVKAHYVGDDGPTDELMAAVQALLVERPMRFQELLDATGARDNRIKGVIMRLQREGVHVINISPVDNKAIWFIPDTAVLERLRRVKRATERR